jgi:hypothetical protein
VLGCAASSALGQWRSDALSRTPKFYVVPLLSDVIMKIYAEFLLYVSIELGPSLELRIPGKLVYSRELQFFSF